MAKIIYVSSYCYSLNPKDKGKGFVVIEKDDGEIVEYRKVIAFPGYGKHNRIVFEKNHQTVFDYAAEEEKERRKEIKKSNQKKIIRKTAEELAKKRYDGLTSIDYYRETETLFAEADKEKAAYEEQKKAGLINKAELNYMCEMIDYKYEVFNEVLLEVLYGLNPKLKKAREEYFKWVESIFISFRPSLHEYSKKFVNDYGDQYGFENFEEIEKFVKDLKAKPYYEKKLVTEVSEIMVSSETNLDYAFFVSLYRDYPKSNVSEFFEWKMPKFPLNVYDVLSIKKRIDDYIADEDKLTSNELHYINCLRGFGATLWSNLCYNNRYSISYSQFEALVYDRMKSYSDNGKREFLNIVKKILFTSTILER